MCPATSKAKRRRQYEQPNRNKNRIGEAAPRTVSAGCGGILRVAEGGMRLRITVEGGGIQITEGEFPFLAPEANYRFAIEINMDKDSKSDLTHRDFQCYFFVNQPRIYGRLKSRVPGFSKESLVIDYWINPSGSRNLEYDPGKYIQTVPANYLQTNTPFIDNMK